MSDSYTLGYNEALERSVFCINGARYNLADLCSKFSIGTKNVFVVTEYCLVMSFTVYKILQKVNLALAFTNIFFVFHYYITKHSTFPYF